MCIQASSATPQHLSFGDSVPIDFEWGVGLEASHYGEADFAGDSETIEGWAQHRESCSAGATDSVQEQPGGVH